MLIGRFISDENTLYIKLNRAVWWPWFVRWPICYALLPVRPPPRIYGRARLNCMYVCVCVQRASVSMCVCMCMCMRDAPAPLPLPPPTRVLGQGWWRWWCAVGCAVLVAAAVVKGSELRTRCAYIALRGPLREGRTRFHVSPPALSHLLSFLLRHSHPPPAYRCRPNNNPPHTAPPHQSTATVTSSSYA